MTTDGYGKLVELDDVGKTVADKDEDIRGRHVIDKDGHTLEKIDALLIDDKERKVRFFQVESVGFLGLWEKKSLIPIDAIVSIDSIDSDEVHIDQPGATVAAAPIHDPALVELRSSMTSTATTAYCRFGVLDTFTRLVRDTRSVTDRRPPFHGRASDGVTERDFHLRRGPAKQAASAM